MHQGLLQSEAELDLQPFPSTVADQEPVNRSSPFSNCVGREGWGYESEGLSVVPCSR
jgi:hypothetical protein